jgi:hypothetical protein
MATGKTARTWGRTLEDMIDRKRNPRTLVVELNGHLKRSLSWIDAVWKVRTTTYDVVNGNAKWRARRPDEYPEADSERWDRLAETAGAIAVSAQELRAFALIQSRKARERRASKDVA